MKTAPWRIAVAPLVLAACGSGTETPQVTTPTLQALVSGFEQPESARWHAATDTWFVSNIAGETAVKDGRGWLSRLDASGTVTAAKWLEGFDAPTGVAADGDRLYVADVDQLRVVDVPTRTIVESVTFEGAGMLNDVEVGPDGAVYVSDTFGQALFRWRPGGTPERFVQDETGSFPNGLAFEGPTLLLASIGPFDDFSAEAPLFEVDLSANALAPVGDAAGKLDGIAAVGDTIYLTDFRGQLLRKEASGLVPVLDLAAAGLMSAADLGADPDRRRLIVPDLFGGQVAVIEVP